MVPKSVILGLCLVSLAACGGKDAAAKPAKTALDAALEEGAPAQNAGVKRVAGKGKAGATRAGKTAADTGEIVLDTTIVRETFAYARGARDPFISLLTSAHNGPELPDLQLVAIYYNERSASSTVAVLREKVTGRRYNVRPGERLGRMRVAEIRPKDITFTLDDFGVQRHETLTLRKQEDERP